MEQRGLRTTRGGANVVYHAFPPVPLCFHGTWHRGHAPGPVSDGVLPCCRFMDVSVKTQESEEDLRRRFLKRRECSLERLARYKAEEGLNADGLKGEEGTFVIFSFWLVSALARAGETERAEELFERLVGYSNDLGLLAEEVDANTGELLGNYPQAFSHIGLIHAAHDIDRARGIETPVRIDPAGL